MDAFAPNLLRFRAMFRKRTPWVLVLAAVVMVGALDMHLADESHEFGGVRADGTYSVSAKHPNAPAHYEPYEPAQQPDCPFCLHQLRISAAPFPLVARLATPIVGIYRGFDSAPVLSERRAAPDGARGPPAL